MASEAESAELSALFERLLTRHRDLSLFIPFILGFANAAATTVREDNINEPNPQNPDQETPNSSERIILINPFTQGMVVIEGGAASTLESLIRDLANKCGPPPASKASIEAMPSVVVGESEGLDVDGECAICLEEWEMGGVVKEMPCKHRFHGNCIEKWLGIHGSCPVCRYKMPVDEDELGKKREDEDGGRRRRLGREIWVSFSLNDSNRGNDDGAVSNQTASNDSDSSRRPEDHEMEN